MADNGQVVGYQQYGHAKALLKGFKQLQHLFLDGDVQGCRGLVGNQQVRLIGQRHGDHDPLLLASGKLVGVAVKPFPGFGNTHQFQQFDNPRPGLLTPQTLVQCQGFADLFFNGMEGVQGRHRFLEDHADGSSANLAHPALPDL